MQDKGGKRLKIIVTGATSMIGVATIKAAVRDGEKVYAVIREDTSRKNRLPSSDLVEVVYADLNELSQISSLPNDADVFYHFAWAGTKKAEREDSVIQEKNIKYSLDAVELAYKCGCRKFVGAGSQAEYGPVFGEITDDTPFNPQIAYGIAKRTASLLTEILCKRYGIGFVWGRVFSVYGKNDNDGTVLRYAIDKFRNRETALFSSGLQQWNYIHERDAGEIFYRLGKSEKAQGEYRIASEETRFLRDFLEELAKQMEAEQYCVFENDDEIRPGLSTTDKRLMNDIGKMDFIPFCEGIREMINE